MQNYGLTCTSKNEQLSIDGVSLFIIKFDTVGDPKSGLYAHLEVHANANEAAKYKVGTEYYFFTKVE